MCGSALTTLRRPIPASTDPAEGEETELSLGFFEGLLDILGGSGLREELEEAIRGTSAVKPISNDFLKTIGRVTIDSLGGLLLDVTLRIGPYKAMLMPSNFAPLPVVDQALNSALVKGIPEWGDSDFTNGSDISGSIVMLKRGKVTFLDKAKRAQAAGAVAVIVSQTYDTWPFVMTDADSADTNGLYIPVLMLSKSDANIVDGLISACRAGKQLAAEINTDKIDPLCSICHDSFAEKDIVLKLPCRHMYHESCVISWLESHNTCPLCRHTMPVQEAAAGATGAGARAERGSAVRQPYFM